MLVHLLYYLFNGHYITRLDRAVNHISNISENDDVNRCKVDSAVVKHSLATTEPEF